MDNGHVSQYCIILFAAIFAVRGCKNEMIWVNSSPSLRGYFNCIWNYGA